MTDAKFHDFLVNAQRHVAENMLEQHTYGKGLLPWFRGSLVGCHAHSILPRIPPERISSLSNIVGLVAGHYGIGTWMISFADTIFNSASDYQRWHISVAEAIADLPPLFDWDAAEHRAHISVLEYAQEYSHDARGLIQEAISLHERAALGEMLPESQWVKIRQDARRAALERSVSLGTGLAAFQLLTFQSATPYGDVSGRAIFASRMRSNSTESLMEIGDRVIGGLRPAPAPVVKPVA